jgi:hypothetical protein
MLNGLQNPSKYEGVKVLRLGSEFSNEARPAEGFAKQNRNPLKKSKETT